MNTFSATPEDPRRRGRGLWIWPTASLIFLLVGAGAAAGTGLLPSSSSKSPTTTTSSVPKIAAAGGASGSSSATAVAPATASGGTHVSVLPKPQITSKPSNPTLTTSATFKYSDSIPAVTFECSLDSSKYAACGHSISPPSSGQITYTNLLPGQHCFSVEAALAVLTSAPAQYCWQQNGQPFTISWIAPQALYPGIGQSADLTISNPNGKAITIAAGGITLQSVSSSSGCPASTFQMTRGLLTSVTIPAKTTRDLLSAGASATTVPVVSMVESNSNQNSCQRATVTFHFLGSATGP